MKKKLMIILLIIIVVCCLLLVCLLHSDNDAGFASETVYSEGNINSLATGSMISDIVWGGEPGSGGMILQTYGYYHKFGCDLVATLHFNIQNDEENPWKIFNVTFYPNVNSFSFGNTIKFIIGDNVVQYEADYEPFGLSVKEDVDSIIDLIRDSEADQEIEMRVYDSGAPSYYIEIRFKKSDFTEFDPNL